ncbi:hypothetical protein Trydic_g22838 [Trypoxylus dichotomus]
MVGPLPCLVTNDPNLVKLAMTSTKVKKSVVYDLGRTFLGGGIITSNGEEWKMQRKLLNPAFHYNILDRYMEVFNIQSDRMMTVLKKELAQDSTETSKHLIEYALKTAYERQVRRNIDELIDTVIRDRNLKIASGLLDENEEFDKKSKPHLLELLLQYKDNNCFYTDQLLRDEIHTVVIAATDTTSTALAYTIQSLADNPEVQERAFREVESIYLQQSQYTTSISDLSKMNYLQAVIQETMRLYPPVPYLTKQLTEDVEHDGMILKKGLTIIIVNCELHRNPKYYTDPNKFIPERFLSEKTNDAHMFSYIPFSGGPRNCIGNKYAMLSMKTFLSKLLLNYEIISVDHKLVLQPEIVLVSKTGFKVRLRTREIDTTEAICMLQEVVIGTTHHVLCIVEQIKEGFNLREYTRAVFFDVGRAFDKVWHQGLLFKMHRAEGIQLEGQRPTVRTATAGVAQGSAISLLLFGIYASVIPATTPGMQSGESSIQGKVRPCFSQRAVSEKEGTEIKPNLPSKEASSPGDLRSKTCGPYWIPEGTGELAYIASLIADGKCLEPSIRY